MDLTQTKFNEFKCDYQLYKPSATQDRYGNEMNVFEAAGTIHCMWTPVADEASIAEFGPDVNRMKQAVLYGGDVIGELWQVDIDGERYEIVSIMPYNTHRLVKVRRVVI